MFGKRRGAEEALLNASRSGQTVRGLATYNCTGDRIMKPLCRLINKAAGGVDMGSSEERKIDVLIL